MKIYLLYRSSKGGKNLHGVFTDKQEAISAASDARRSYLCGSTFRVYEVEAGCFICFEKLPCVFQTRCI